MRIGILIVAYRLDNSISLQLMAGIVGDCLTGTYYRPERLTRAVNRGFNSNTLRDLLDCIPLLMRRRRWFLYGGTPAHASHIFRDALAEI